MSSFLPSDRVLNNIGSICIYDGVRVCLTTQNSMQRQNATKQKRRERKNQHTNACMVPFIDFVVAKIFNKTNWLKLSHDFQLNSILFDSIETFECISIACIVDAVVAIVLPYKLYIVFCFVISAFPEDSLAERCRCVYYFVFGTSAEVHKLRESPPIFGSRHEVENR